MKLRNLFNKPQKVLTIHESSDKAGEPMIDSPKPPESEWDMYNELLTMNMFANYYPSVFPDQNMFR